MQDFFKSQLFIAGVGVVCLFLLAALWRRPVETKLAEIDGVAINERQLEATLRRQLSQLNQQIYTLKRQKLDELINAQLLNEDAKRRGISVATLLEQEVESRVSTASDEEIGAFYQTHKTRLNVELDKIHNQIRDHLKEQGREARKTEYFKALRSKAKITTYLEAPPALRAEMSIAGAPFKGAEKAQVHVVKFEDFECPFCKTVQPTLSELLKKYDGKVRLVHKDLPLEDIHRQAQLAAEAARCAGDQGKFWQYHDTLYSHAPKLSPADLKAYAKDVGLDGNSFDQCLVSGRHKEAVKKEVSEGMKLGLTGTPSFFINGRELSGAQPLEAFTAIIDEELALAK